ncbi:macro domain-containing protein [Mucilaginibacter sp. SJ]|uniref:macro domain-containing protein n=1 Tax=Mucilaginibacter sp. SJ TaxID=3029053 RepID=UPI0023A9BF29|nr:macro domain-containing protein [Mucilaginibacter sp. SJ]WEA00704.1 macro domain-containing protein [Mucilaginibacter sp. SJ]
MITYKKGNLLNDEAFALVNTVNTVGVMGKGIALAFKKAFPDNYLLYRAACLTGKVCVGELFIVPDSTLLMGQRLIINFPTKKDWRDPSEYEFVELGLGKLRNLIISNKINSIAMPALGCGNGGLDWEKVRPMIEGALEGLDCAVSVYEPG